MSFIGISASFRGGRVVTRRACNPVYSLRGSLLRQARTFSEEQKTYDGDLRPIKGRFDLSGKNIIVTGGARGIGYSAVRAIAEMGGNVCVWDVASKPVADFASLADEFNVKTEYIQTDVTNPEGLNGAFNQTMTHFDRLDGCVTAAGVVIEGPFVDCEYKPVAKLLDVNVLGTFLTAQLAARQMQKQGGGGSIVLIASVSATTKTPGHQLSPYNASKAAVRMLGQAISIELGPDQIRVNCVSPGYTDTELLTPFKEQQPQRVDLMNKAPPLERIGNRNDLTPAIVYLLSEASSYTTGTDIQVSGGLHVGRVDVE
ncbi:short chain dehydrogenase [Talaromyces proteolyticus]|uniref:Short chain dehydrogenase n=1 Tax=Talaromyces proteolyticus TaxID=1131652 RepID=A0AAD4PZC5_9EURO|nr:short chain dehydrogenase [Talaromyces proteolyticus]KAH8695622.1 short chain dehydrogenase [Talaromyces proteolyticus]